MDWVCIIILHACENENPRYCVSSKYYEAIFPFTTFPDNDECALGTHNCAQDCNNNPGSFTCACYAGYRLQSDGRSCNGECSYRRVIKHLCLLEQYQLRE